MWVPITRNFPLCLRLLSYPTIASWTLMLTVSGIPTSLEARLSGPLRTSRRIALKEYPVEWLDRSNPATGLDARNRTS